MARHAASKHCAAAHGLAGLRQTGCTSGKALYSVCSYHTGAYSGKPSRARFPLQLCASGGTWPGVQPRLLRVFGDSTMCFAHFSSPSGRGLLGSPLRWPQGFSKPLLRHCSPPSPGGFGQLHPEPDVAQSCSSSSLSPPAPPAPRPTSGAPIAYPMAALPDGVLPSPPPTCPSAQSTMETGGSWVATLAAPHPQVLLRPWDAGSPGGGGDALGGSHHSCPRAAPSHPVLVVFQGGVGCPAVLQQLGVSRHAWTLRRWSCAFAIQGIDSR